MPKKKSKHNVLTIKTLVITSIVMAILPFILPTSIEPLFGWDITFNITLLLIIVCPIINIILLIYFIIHYWKTNRKMIFPILIMTQLSLLVLCYVLILPFVSSIINGNRRGGQTHCASAVNCHDNDDGKTVTCNYYDDNMQLSKDTIICDKDVHPKKVNDDNKENSINAKEKE